MNLLKLDNLNNLLKLLRLKITRYSLNLTPEEAEFLADIVELQDIKFDSLKKHDREAMKAKKVTNSIKNKLKNVEYPSSYLFR